MLCCHPIPLIECLRAQITSTKTPVLTIIFRVPMQCVSPYLKPHISAKSWRMKTTKRPYFMVTSRRFIFRSQKIFFAFIFTSNCHDDVMITSLQQASSWSWRWIFKIFWDRQTAFKEGSYDRLSLSCLHTARSRWATRALELDLR
jgi:hypothetical protein